MKLWLLLLAIQAVSLALVIGLGVTGTVLGIVRSNTVLDEVLIHETALSITDLHAKDSSALFSRAMLPALASLRLVKSFAATHPTDASSFSALVSSSYSRVWRDSMMTHASNLFVAGQTAAVEQLLWFPSSSTSVLTMRLRRFGSGSSPSYYFSRRNPAVDSVDTQSDFLLSVDSNGVVNSQASLGTTTTVDPDHLACLRDPTCFAVPFKVSLMNVTDQFGTSTLVFPSVTFGLVGTFGSQRSLTVARSSLDFIRTEMLASKADIEASVPHDSAVFALVDPLGNVADTTSLFEADRRSRCFALPTFAAIEACLIVPATAYPDSFLVKAVSGLPNQASLTELTVVEAGDVHYIAVPISVDGSSEPWVLYFGFVPHEASYTTIVSLTVIFAVIEFATATLFLRIAQVKFRKPLTLLGRVLDSAANLNFSETEVARTELAGTEVLELIELTSVCFEMTDAIAGFGKYVPQEVIRELQQTEGLHSRVMTARVLTFIIVDIAGFTTMCESMSAEDLAELAEKYFSVATRTCTIHGATIDKFIGDAIAGFWGAPLDYTTQGFSGCCTALHLQTVVDRLQPTFQSRGQTLTIRIGLHRGHSLVGNIGCDSRMTYTAIGATASIAGKLESLNKEYDTNIIVSGAVLSDAQRTWENLIVARRLGSIPSEDSPVTIFELCGLRKSAAGNIAPATVARERLRRKAPTVDGTVRSFLGEPSEGGGSMADMATTVKVSSNGSHSSGEKFAQLTIDEEVSVIKPSYFLEEDVVAAIDILSQAAMAAEATDFECAVRYMQCAMNDHSIALSQSGIRPQRLEKLVKHYEKAMRSRPNGAWKM